MGEPGKLIPGTNIRVTRASDLVQDYLTTGSKILDTFLYGGIPTFGVTEIVGEAGTGKTQFCLQLALNAQLPKSVGGLESESVYISTDRRLPSGRLNELALHLTASQRKHLKGPATNKVRVEHISDSESLINCLETRLPQLITSKPRVIIVDSVASLFRTDYLMEDMEKRTQDIRHVSRILHDLGSQLKAAIVVVNQMSVQSVDADEDDIENAPALGLAWKNCVTTRIQLTREGDESKSAVKEEELDVEIGEARWKRFLSIKFAPHVPNRTIQIRLDQEGIRAAPDVPEYLLYVPSDSDTDSET